MGVKDLWGILNPTCERKPIWELQGKTIAVDLSAWICDSSTVAEHSSQRNMYLRNLFFRTSYLLLLGVKPIFVLEGKAPVLKHDTIERRQIAQAKSAGRNVKAAAGSNGSRKRLKGLQTQCATLLSSLGLECTQGDGEAEAFCARLNEAGIVDGVVTQDSDVFLYGAVTVFRHFNTSSAGGGSVDTYEMREIASRLGLGRNHLIALSLLCGCDYGKGVPGVGKESALKFFQSVPDDQILDRIRSWRQNTHLDTIDVKKDKSISPEYKAELQIRSKALQDPDFPCEELLAEFLQTNQRLCPKAKFQWSKPNISQFLKIADVKLAWDSTYSLEKILPLLSRWHLIHQDFSLEPELILSAKTTKGVKGYVVKWKEFEVTTQEPQNLVEERFPRLVEIYLESKKKGKKPAKKNKENEENVPPKTKSKQTKAKAPQGHNKEDTLQEIITEQENGDRGPHHIEDTKVVQRNDKENKTKLKKSKEKAVDPELKTKITRKKNAKIEELGEKQENLCRNKKQDTGSADIRQYFKSKLKEKLHLPESKELFEDSLSVLHTSMHSLSISKAEHNDEERSTNNKRSFITDLEMSSIIVENIENLNGRPRDKVGRELSNNDSVLDYSMADISHGQITSDNVDHRNLIRIDGQSEEKFESVHLIEDGDIFNYSFNTACRIVKNPESTKTDQIQLVSDVTRKSVEIKIDDHSVLNFTDENINSSDINKSMNLYEVEKYSENNKNCKTRENPLSQKKEDINKLNNSDFHMSVNTSYINTDLSRASEILYTSQNYKSNDVENNPEVLYESFQSQLKSLSTSATNGRLEVESMSFVEDQQISMDMSHKCDVTESPSYSSKTKISQISSVTSKIFPQRSSTLWNTSSPLVKYKPTQVSTPELKAHRNNTNEVRSQAVALNSPTNTRVNSSFSFDMADFECNETEDLSGIIENIVSQK